MILLGKHERSVDYQQLFHGKINREACRSFSRALVGSAVALQTRDRSVKRVCDVTHECALGEQSVTVSQRGWVCVTTNCRHDEQTKN